MAQGRKATCTAGNGWFWVLVLLVLGGGIAGASTEEEKILQELLQPRIIVKFVEGLEIRLSEGRISGSINSECPPPADPGKQSLDKVVIDRETRNFNVLTEDSAVVGIGPVFSQEASGLQPVREECPKERDLRLYYSIALKDLSQAEVDLLLDKLNLLKIVETAYLAPVPENAGLPMQTPNPP